jgi:hypothetical protein
VFLQKVLFISDDLEIERERKKYSAAPTSSGTGEVCARLARNWNWRDCWRCIEPRCMTKLQENFACVYNLPFLSHLAAAASIILCSCFR